jgi:putative intracellular protease/amidase
MSKIYIYLFDGYSDWEIAYLAPELNKSENHELIYLSEHGDRVTSMGGLRVEPSGSLHEVELEEMSLLILPGGEAWENENPKGIKQLLREAYDSNKNIAAICAATTFLGRSGMLNEVKHTSNDLNYLKGIAPAYQGEPYYQNTLAVTDGNIITANGIAPIEFAREIFRKVGLYDEATLEQWFQLFKNGIWKG